MLFRFANKVIPELYLSGIVGRDRRLTKVAFSLWELGHPQPKLKESYCRVTKGTSYESMESAEGFFYYSVDSKGEFRSEISTYADLLYLNRVADLLGANYFEEFTLEELVALMFYFEENMTVMMGISLPVENKGYRRAKSHHKVALDRMKRNHGEFNMCLMSYHLPVLMELRANYEVNMARENYSKLPYEWAFDSDSDDGIDDYVDEINSEKEILFNFFGRDLVDVMGVEIHEKFLDAVDKLYDQGDNLVARYGAKECEDVTCAFETVILQRLSFPYPTNILFDEHNPLTISSIKLDPLYTVYSTLFGLPFKSTSRQLWGGLMLGLNVLFFNWDFIEEVVCGSLISCMPPEYYLVDHCPVCVAGEGDEILPGLFRCDEIHAQTYPVYRTNFDELGIESEAYSLVGISVSGLMDSMMKIRDLYPSSFQVSRLLSRKILDFYDSLEGLLRDDGVEQFSLSAGITRELIPYYQFFHKFLEDKKVKPFLYHYYNVEIIKALTSVVVLFVQVEELGVFNYNWYAFMVTLRLALELRTFRPSFLENALDCFFDLDDGWEYGVDDDG